MRRYLQTLCARLFRALQPKPDHEKENVFLKQLLHRVTLESLEDLGKAEAMERMSELIEARRMAGSGPWATSEEVLRQTDHLLDIAAARMGDAGAGERLREVALRETSITAQGAYGDIELALQNVEWRREVNMSWLEFSRWGIQQIILISRLYYIKNPIIQRGINVAAHYVFGRGVEVTSPDEKAAAVLKDFFERNQKTLGQVALTDLERRKYYDGNLFFVFFADTASKGKVDIRTIDATEIQDVVTDPEDTDTPRFYKRVWTERTFDLKNGNTATKTHTLWYPAVGYEETKSPPTIGSDKVMWDQPILHVKCGAVAKWNFGCPLVYAALDWAKQSVRFLQHCATVKQSLAQVSMLLTSKGGQQALQGAKGQLQTTVNTGSNIWDTNPTAVDASVFASGPGTKLEAFNTKGAGGDPEEVRRFILMAAMVFGIPETFFSDVQTGNLATATSLDRPTELNFLEKQQSWEQTITSICKFVLKVSAGAPSGALRESLFAAGVKTPVQIVEAKRVWEGGINGRFVMRAAAKPTPGVVEIVVTFPAIVEGDVPDLMQATLAAAQTGKLDDKVIAEQCYSLLPDVKNGQEIADAQYPDTVEQRAQKKADDAKALAAAAAPKPTLVAESAALAKKLVESISKTNDSQIAGLRDFVEKGFESVGVAITGMLEKLKPTEPASVTVNAQIHQANGTRTIVPVRDAAGRIIRMESTESELVTK